MFGGIKPDPFQQNKETGANQITSAESLIFSAIY